MALRQINANKSTGGGQLSLVQEDAQTLLPYIRSKSISFTAKGLKPFTRMYAYFDKRAVNANVTPASS